MSKKGRPPEDAARSPLDSQEAFARSMIRNLRVGLPPDVSDAELEEPVENALVAEATRNEQTIAGLRLAFLVVLAVLELVVTLFDYGSQETTLFIAAAAGAALLFYRKLRGGWYHPLMRKIVPAADAAIIIGAFAVYAFTGTGTADVSVFSSSATACVFLAFSGALRLSRNAARISASLAIGAWVSIILISRWTGEGNGWPSMLFAGAFVSAALVGTGYLGTHITRTIRRVVMNEVGRTRFATLFDQANAAVKAREEVLNIVSHDLKNPIHTISITAELLMLPEAGELPLPKRNDFLRRIHRAAGNMNRMISDLFDVARMQAGKLTVTPAPVACADLIAEVGDQMAPLAADRQLELRMMCPENAPILLADQVRIMQVFSNLIGNAIKFTPPGGLICVQAQRVADKVRFSVSDTGPGIPPEQRDKIFERLWQADRSDGRGLGLGLAIAKAIVEAHGERIGIDPPIAQGTTFYFTVAIAPPPGAGEGI